MELNFDELKKQWELAEQSAKSLAERLNQAKFAERSVKIAEIVKMIADFEITDEDIKVPQAKKGKATAQYIPRESKSPFRYVNLSDIAFKWTGKGKSPSWLPENEEDRIAYKVENALAKLTALPQPHSEAVKVEIELMQHHIKWAEQVDAEKAAKAAAKAVDSDKQSKTKTGKPKVENSRINLTTIACSTTPTATSSAVEIFAPSQMQVMSVPSSTGYTV